MYLYIVIGATQQGKSTFVKNLISKSKRKKYIFDVYGEYKNNAYKGNINELEFIEYCSNVYNSIVIIEEATGFFVGRVNKEVRRFIIKKSKAHNNNILFFIFHSISDVPPFFLRLADYIVLFKTNDEPQVIKYKYSLYYNHYINVRMGKVKLPLVINNIENKTI